MQRYRMHMFSRNTEDMTPRSALAMEGQTRVLFMDMIMEVTRNPGYSPLVLTSHFNDSIKYNKTDEEDL